MKTCARIAQPLFGLLLTLSGVAAHATVTLTDNGTSVTVANGIVTATIDKSSGQVTSMTLGSLESVSGNIYYSLDGGTSYQQPGPCVYSITQQTADLVDLDFFQVYTNQIHPMDIDLHYVMLTGVSGLYTYAILNHPANYPALSFGEWRTVWKHPNNGTTYTFENEYVDSQRHFQGPSYYDITQASPTAIAEVVYLNTGVLKGQYWGKYEFNAEYFNIGTWGHASNVNHAGAWVIPGSYEFFNDGPPKQDLTIAEDYVLIHYGRNHYNGSGTSVAAGEAWTKIYGPNLLYLNSCPTGADACWTDAQNRINTEHAAWPYTWLNASSQYNISSLYPQASGRGTITGTLTVSDRLKPSLTGAGAWVGVAQPDSGGNWQFESKRYEYWAQADSAGSFTIPNVRPGTYGLSAFVKGAIGEYTLNNVTVSAGATTNAGTLTYNVYHPGSSIAWEIGFPDRTAYKFANGTNYNPFLYDGVFESQFTNPLNYTVGTSSYATAWNYVQSGWCSGSGPLGPCNNPLDTVNYDANNYNDWPWNINFNLSSVPTSNPTLTVQIASTDGSSTLSVYVNDPNRVNPALGSFLNNVTGGNALVRQGKHAKYPNTFYLSIPTSSLVVGTNTITLLTAGAGAGVSHHNMFDYINLEMPGAATPDFSMSASPSSQTVTQGSNTSYTATVTALNGFSGTVNLSVSGLPSGATGSFNPTSVAGSGNSTLTVSTSSTTPTGTYTLTVTGSSGSLTHSTTVTLVVNGPPDFSISASPSSQTVTQGSNTSYTTTVAALNGFTGTVNLSVSGLPSGASGSFNPTSVAGSGNSTLSVSTSSTTPAGTYTLTITGTNGSLTHSTTVTLAVNAAGGGNFTLSATPSSRTLSVPGSTTYTVTVTPSGGFAGTVAFSVSGLPAGTTASFNPSSLAGSGSSTLTVTGSCNSSSGTFTLTITGTSGSLSHSTTVTLVVNTDNC